jgi:hypothetical protein
MSSFNIGNLFGSLGSLLGQGGNALERMDHIPEADMPLVLNTVFAILNPTGAANFTYTPEQFARAFEQAQIMYYTHQALRKLIPNQGVGQIVGTLAGTVVEPGLDQGIQAGQNDAATVTSTSSVSTTTPVPGEA